MRNPFKDKGKEPIVNVDPIIPISKKEYTEPSLTDLVYTGKVRTIEVIEDDIGRINISSLGSIDKGYLQDIAAKEGITDSGIFDHSNEDSCFFLIKALEKRGFSVNHRKSAEEYLRKLRSYDILKWIDSTIGEKGLECNRPQLKYVRRKGLLTLDVLFPGLFRKNIEILTPGLIYHSNNGISDLLISGICIPSSAFHKEGIDDTNDVMGPFKRIVESDVRAYLVSNVLQHPRYGDIRGAKLEEGLVKKINYLTRQIVDLIFALENGKVSTLTPQRIIRLYASMAGILRLHYVGKNKSGNLIAVSNHTICDNHEHREKFNERYFAEEEGVLYDERNAEGETHGDIIQLIEEPEKYIFGDYDRDPETWKIGDGLIKRISEAERLKGDIKQLRKNGR